MPRTLAENATYIAETIKPAIKQAIEDKGVTVPSTDSFLDYADRIGEIEGGGSGYQLKDLPTGSIATVNDAAELPLNALTVSVEAWQEGSGDPSPSNVRSIHGWDSGEISVYKSKNTVNLTQGAFDIYGNNTGETNRCRSDYIAVEQGKSYTFQVESTSEKIPQLYVFWAIGTLHQDMMDRGSVWTDNEITLTPPQGYNYARVLYRYSDNSDVSPNNFSNTYVFESLITHQVAFPKTIYGAEWNVTDGGMNNQYKIVDLGDLTWDASTGNGWAQARVLTDAKPVPDDEVADIMCEIFAPASGVDVYFRRYDNTAAINNNRRFQVYSSQLVGITSAEDITTWMTGYKLKYELATPTTIPQQPLTPRMLEGVNNLYADCGEVIEGEYFVDEGAIDVRKVDYSIGSNSALKISDGRILQGFVQMSGYHALPLGSDGTWLDIDWSKSFEIGIAFKYTVADTNQTLFGSGIGNANYYKCPMIMLHPASQQFEIDISTTGNSWDMTMSQTVTYASLTINTWYFLKMMFNQSDMSLVIQISDDFSTWDTLLSITMSAAYYHDAASLCFGGFVQNSSFSSNNLLIDTFNTCIKGDGVSWGAFTGAFPS